MSEIRRNPSFHIVPNNQLLGNKSLVMMSPEMSRSLCDLIDRTELEDDEGHLYAFMKSLRRYYWKMNEMYQEKTEEVLEETVGV